jgi:Transposase DDE domain
VHGFLAEHRPRLFPDEMFADLFPSGRGRPSVPADVTPTVMVFDDFDIVQTAGTVTCPAGITVQTTARRHARFGRNCATCPLRSRCTTATRGRVIVLHPHHALLAAARALAATDSFHDTYRRHRPMVERSIAWLVRGANRRLRDRGVDRNRLWLGHRVAAVNLHRLVSLGLTHHADRWAIA